MPVVITASKSSWTAPFTGLSPRQFGKLLTALRREGANVAYWRTYLTMWQLAPLFSVSKSAAHRIIDHLGPLPALQPRKRFAKDAVLIVDGWDLHTSGLQVETRPSRHDHSPGDSETFHRPTQAPPDPSGTA